MISNGLAFHLKVGALQLDEGIVHLELDLVRKSEQLSRRRFTFKLKKTKFSFILTVTKLQIWNSFIFKPKSMCTMVILTSYQYLLLCKLCWTVAGKRFFILRKFSNKKEIRKWKWTNVRTWNVNLDWILLVESFQI